MLRALSLTISLILLCAAISCGKKEEAKGPQGPWGGPLKVKVLPLKKESIAEQYARVATVRYKRRLALTAELDGRIAEISRSEGDLVKKDDLIAKMDNERLKLEVTRKYSEAKRCEVFLDKKILDYERIESLAKSKDSTVTKSELELAKMEMSIAETNLVSAKAELRLIERDLKDSEIHAPFDAVLTARKVEVGDYVKRGAFLFEIADPDTLEIEVGVVDALLVHIKTGATVPVEIPALKGLSLQGKVTHVGRSATMGTNAYPVIVEFPNQQGRLVSSGMIARVLFKGKNYSDVYLIPRHLVEIQKETNKSVVYVVNGGEAVVLEREVAIDGEVGENMVVKEGVKEGDNLIVASSRRPAANEQAVVEKEERR